MSNKTLIKNFIFGSKTIEYELDFQDRKTLGIRVYPSCKVKVIAPLETSHEALKEKLRKKAPWILKQQNEFLSFYPLTPPRKFVNGETHLYLGRQYKLKIKEDKVNEVTLVKGKLTITVNKQITPSTLLENWYREKAKSHFRTILDQTFLLFAKYKVQAPELQIRTMPTRWGSCTSLGKIILNPELVKAPKGCIEYVIIHELCHLVHHNHTADFYRLQESIMPDWKKWKERLEMLLT